MTPTDDTCRQDAAEWSKEALDGSAQKKCRSSWDAMPADVGVGETPKQSRWDYVFNGFAGVLMTPISMNVPGFMQEDKHNHYLGDKELDAILPSAGYSIFTHLLGMQDSHGR